MIAKTISVSMKIVIGCAMTRYIPILVKWKVNGNCSVIPRVFLGIPVHIFFVYLSETEVLPLWLGTL